MTREGKRLLDMSVIRCYRFSYLFSKLVIISLLLFQLFYSLGRFYEQQEYEEAVSHIIRERVALDLPVIKGRLPLGEISDDRRPYYLQALNEQLDAQGVLYRVVAISASPLHTDLKLKGSLELKLSTSDEHYRIQVRVPATGWLMYFSIWPWLAAALFSFIVSYHVLVNRKLSIPAPTVEQDPRVITIDLKQKLLINPITGKSVLLANKPLCFYTGLIDYCIKHPGASLNPNKELPDELEQLAKKYFKRLIDLGHTIRKRPNFGSNLEKALSEIRAALDELFEEDIVTKYRIYPKKAVGEGSRSKAHSYALEDVSREMIEIIGR